MSAYNIEYLLADFSNRTIDNLKFVENNANAFNVFEVTQLINSLLGLIIIPVESVKQTQINDYKLEKSSSDDYYKIKELISKCNEEKRLYTDYTGERSESLEVSRFIRHLRNSIAHGGNHGIRFYPINESQNISHIIFYDDNTMTGGNNEFCVKLSIQEIRTIVFSVSKLYCQFEKKNVSVSKKQADYDNEIYRRELLMRDGKKINV